MIEIEALHKRFASQNGTHAVNGISFEVPVGSFVTLLGPSGCGKTTTMRLIAGLERPTGGAISIDGECMSSVATKTFVPPERRPIGMVFQSYAIWPHMTVAENVAFPLRVVRPRIARSEVVDRVNAALALVGLEGYADRPSPALSGGQQQRVALARALVRRPKILLLDEPLSNLDTALRERMRDEIREVQQRLGITTVFVTHDQSEALAMSDRIVVMNEGQIVESGAPEEIYGAPRHSFTAGFLGVSNMFSGTVESCDGSVATVRTPQGVLTGPATAGLRVGNRVEVAMRPDSFKICRNDTGEQAWPATVRLASYHGDAWVYHLDVGAMTIKVRVNEEKVGLRHADRVFVVPRSGTMVITQEGDPDVE